MRCHRVAREHSGAVFDAPDRAGRAPPIPKMSTGPKAVYSAYTVAGDTTQTFEHHAPRLATCLGGACRPGFSNHGRNDERPNSVSNPAVLALVGLPALMERTPGNPDINIGLIDGAVATGHPDLLQQRLREVSVSAGATCVQIGSAACQHGTFVAGILFGQTRRIRYRDLPRLRFACPADLRRKPVRARTQNPSAAPEALAAAILDCLAAGARVINLSLGLAQPSGKGKNEPWSKRLIRR